MTTSTPELVRGTRSAPTRSAAAELDAVLSNRAVFSLFQPIVDLRTRGTVAFEALSRGPEGSSLQRADKLFAAAREAGRHVELDRLCRDRALEAVVGSGTNGPRVLFVNREPDAIGGEAPTAAQLMILRRAGIRVVVELTERALTADPATLLAYADRMRAAGMGLAVDDVGADAASLALMPLLRPDVVKLDLSLVQQRPDAAAARTVAAVTAYAEQSGAYVLAEGIETEEHERTAVGLGATLGQGWRFGRPAPLGEVVTGTSAPAASQRPLVLHRPEQPPAAASPFETVTRSGRSQRAGLSLLFELRKVLEHQTEQMHGHAVVLLTGADTPDVSIDCVEHYGALVASSAFVAALGTGIPDELVPGLRGAELQPGDPVGEEWDLVVVGPHFAAALVARERVDGGPDAERTFDYVLTYDRAVVLEVACSLMRRAMPIAPLGRDDLPVPHAAR